MTAYRPPSVIIPSSIRDHPVHMSWPSRSKIFDTVHPESTHRPSTVYLKTVDGPLQVWEYSYLYNKTFYFKSRNEKGIKSRMDDGMDAGWTVPKKRSWKVDGMVTESCQNRKIYCTISDISLTCQLTSKNWDTFYFKIKY